MKNVLLINSSLNGEQGNSSILAQQFVKKLSATLEVQVVDRDLTEIDLPHLNQDEMSTWMIQPEERNANQTKLAKISDTLIEELIDSDLIIVGMPMYNFGVPSSFKAWIDRIARAGKTFNYSETGPIGLLKNKKVIIVATRGGLYAGTPKDSQSQYLKDVFAFIGITDIEFVYAEGLNMPIKNEGLKKAYTRMDELILEGTI